MKKALLGCLMICLSLSILAPASYAEPSAKAAAQLGNLSALPLGGTWEEGTIFSQLIKTPTGKDLFIDVSLECGLTTNTKVASKLLQREMATADAVVKVRVLVDGYPVAVNGMGDSEIIFARREQTLIAEFAGDIRNCISVNPITGVVTVDNDCVSPETLQLILNTMTANSFNFIVPDLLAGEHWVTIQAKLEYVDDGAILPLQDYAVTGSEASAYLGNGSVTVETVRMVKDEDVIVDLQ